MAARGHDRPFGMGTSAARSRRGHRTGGAIGIEDAVRQSGRSRWSPQGRSQSRRGAWRKRDRRPQRQRRHQQQRNREQQRIDRRHHRRHQPGIGAGCACPLVMLGRVGGRRMRHARHRHFHRRRARAAADADDEPTVGDHRHESGRHQQLHRQRKGEERDGKLRSNGKKAAQRGHVTAVPHASRQVFASYLDKLSQGLAGHAQRASLSDLCAIATKCCAAVFGIDRG